MKLSHNKSKIVAAAAISMIGVAGVAAVEVSAFAATMASSTSSHPTLSVGSHGSAVAILQSALNSNGAHLAVDGSFGPATLSAVKQFQASQDLVTDGIVGPLTWTTLGSPSAPSSTNSKLTSLGIAQTSINGARANGYALDISKRTRMLYLLHSSNGKVSVAASSVVSFAGCNADGCFSTPSGVFHVTYKGGANVRSAMWHNAAMPYPVYFTWTGYAVHQDPLGQSHGCIHVPNMATMKYVNSVMPTGAVVNIHS